MPGEEDQARLLGDESTSESSTRKRRVGCCVLVSVVLVAGLILWLLWRAWTLGPLFHDDDLGAIRPAAATAAEGQRRAAAEAEGGLLTLRDLPNAKAVAQNVGTGNLYSFFNFVQGFPKPGFSATIRWKLGSLFGQNSPKWKPPVQGEKMGVMNYQEYAREHFGKEFPQAYFGDYYTGGRIPSWEDNDNHKNGVKLLDASVKGARALGQEPIEQLRPLEPRFAFDNQALMKAAWDGFRYTDPLEIKYASNGFYGIAVVERLMEKYNTSGEVLGLLMTDSVFSAHLRHDEKDGLYHVDLDSMSKYKPIPGYARLGGTAAFMEDEGKLRTVKLTYDGKTYTDFAVPEVNADYVKSKRSGWRYAEGAIIASLLSMTNLVMHVKDLHLEIAAAFQATTVDAFANEPKHPVRRLLDPFISRSVQATNDNFKLLFEYHAADFSLAPLPDDEQLKLIGDAIETNPLNLASMDMEHYGKLRNISEDHSTADAITSSGKWGWRWHYRALTVQRLYDKLVTCWLKAHYSSTGDADISGDAVLQAWWRSMIDHLPSLKRATNKNPEWASPEKLTASSLRHVLRTLLVWLSWIHEDVGHSAAAYVYNPVYTPMCVPEDGVGVPRDSWTFNAAAYRGFVFLHRATLMEEPPDFWFDGNNACRQCFADFQTSLRDLGQRDAAFSECDKTGFYSCVDRVETAVSS